MCTFRHLRMCGISRIVNSPNCHCDLSNNSCTRKEFLLYLFIFPLSLSTHKFRATNFPEKQSRWIFLSFVLFCFSFLARTMIFFISLYNEIFFFGVHQTLRIIIHVYKFQANFTLKKAGEAAALLLFVSRCYGAAKHILQIFRISICQNCTKK